MAADLAIAASPSWERLVDGFFFRRMFPGWFQCGRSLRTPPPTPSPLRMVASVTHGVDPRRPRDVITEISDRNGILRNPPPKKKQPNLVVTTVFSRRPTLMGLERVVSCPTVDRRVGVTHRRRRHPSTPCPANRRSISSPVPRAPTPMPADLRRRLPTPRAPFFFKAGDDVTDSSTDGAIVLSPFSTAQSQVGWWVVRWANF